MIRLENLEAIPAGPVTISENGYLLIKVINATTLRAASTAIKTNLKTDGKLKRQIVCRETRAYKTIP
ncbi:MAG: hypothetical protein AAB691_01740 [Patescibacteria group bacterium]